MLLTGVCFSQQENPGARQAWSVVSANVGPDLASRVIEVSGQRGTTQPRTWRFVLADPTTKGGVRIVEVQNGKLGRQKTPDRALVGGGNVPTFNLAAFQTDSLQAFQAANQEAVRSHIGFDSADYALRVDVHTGKPTWVVTLVSRSEKPLGHVFVSPTTGRVTRVENVYAGKPNVQPGPPPPEKLPPPQYVPAPSTTTTTTVVEVGPKHPREYDLVRDTEGFFEKAGRDLDTGNYYLEKGVRRFGARLQELFTGRRTVDRKYYYEQVPPQD